MTATARPAPPTSDIAPDCRHYRGDRPCVHNRLCAGCGHYQPYAHRLCVIKLGALGDVVRTLCILPELHRNYPGAQVTWVSLPAGCRMIAGHRLIDRVLPFDALTALTLGQEEFDLLINLDKEPQPCALAMSLHAKRKLGIGLSPLGTPIPINPEAHDYFLLGLSDELKFRRNRKSYPQLVYEALGWEYRGQRYELPRDADETQRARVRLSALGWSVQRPTLGVVTGAGQAFANKVWPPQRLADLITQLRRELPAVQVVLLGGTGERPAIDRITALLRAAGEFEGVFDPGTDHDERAFVALVDACDGVFTGDTMAMHVAIALGKGVTAFFGPTCEQEIDLFGRGRKLVAASGCAPCYKRRCDQRDVCVHDISIRDTIDAITATLRQAGRGDVSLPIRPARLAG